MQVKNTSDCKSLLSFTRTSSNRSLKKSVSSIVMSPIYNRIKPRLTVKRRKNHTSFRFSRTRAEAGYGNQGDISEEDDDLCPVECVKEFNSDEEFTRILDKASEAGSLVIVDFYRTSCGSCKYIEQGFAKLCRFSGDDEAPVIFLKHNVLDEYDEQSEVAERLRIKTVPLFHFYKNGLLLEAFATRDKERIMEAIRKYTSSESQLS